MKLKRLFLANILAALFISCASNNIALPVPGKSEIVTNNIYIEYMNIADIYFSLEKYDKAAQFYEYAMMNKDNYWSAYYKLGQCYVYQNKYDSALRIYYKLLDRDQNNNSLKSSIAYMEAQTGNTKKALELYDNLIINNPNEAIYLENKIAVLLALENNAEAEELFNQLQEEFPENATNEKFSKYFEELNKKEETESTEVETSTDDSVSEQEKVSKK